MKPIFTLRLKELQILDNREIGKAEVKIFSFIASNDISVPALDEYFKEIDKPKREKFLKEISRQVVSTKILTQVDYIKDNHLIEFGDTGKSLWTINYIPRSFNWTSLVLESDEDIREFGKKVDDLVTSDEFNSFIPNILTVASISINPVATAYIEIGKFILRQISSNLMKNKDDQIGLIDQSFIREFDYPGLRREAFGVYDLSRNMLYSYLIFGQEGEK